MNTDELEIRQKKGLNWVRGLTATAVICVAAIVGLAFYSLMSDRSRVLNENVALKAQLAAFGEEAQCRSVAAAAQADAQGVLAVATSEAAEFAFSGGLSGDPATIKVHLEEARTAVLETTAARNGSVESCDLADFVSLWPPRSTSVMPCPPGHTFQTCKETP